jgi:hypothetical protein
MGITLGELKANRRAVTIEFDGLEFEVTYRPGAITPTFGEEERGDKTWLIQVLLKLIDSWAVFEDDEETQRAPLTQETLSSEAFGVPLLRAMYEQILDDALLPKARAATSQSG